MGTKAQAFALYFHVEVEAWMESPLWADGWIGCARCAFDGPEPGCWGLQSCHGYQRGCGCNACIARDRLELLPHGPSVARDRRQTIREA